MSDPTTEPALAAIDQLAAASPSASFDEWIARGRLLARIDQRLKWILADLAADGAGRFDAAIKRASELAPLNMPSVRKAAKVAAAFPPDMRDGALQFEVHATLARLPDDARDDAFADARAERWTKRQAVKAVEQWRQETMPTDEDDPDRLATLIFRAWNNAPAEAREYAWPLLEAGAKRGFRLIDEEEALD